MATVAYGELVKTFTRLYRFQHALSILGWDEMVNLPSGGVDARAGAKAELEVLSHEILLSEATKSNMAAVQAAPWRTSLSNDQQANFREMLREYTKATKLPTDHVEKVSMACSQAQAVWGQSRSKNDWNAFLPELKGLVELKRIEGKLLAEGTSMSPYEALMDQHEPGMSLAVISKVFAEVKTWLPALLKEILEKQKTLPEPVNPVGPFPVDQQRELGLDVMRALLQFDFNRGRVDVSKHPFCGGVSEDVRLTTRYNEETFDQSLMGIVHETGHARYEQNRPIDWITQPVSQARSMGVHESQSLFFEMQIGRSPAFMKQLAPLLSKHFPDPRHQECFTSANLHRLYTKVCPGLIRVDADEVCYPLHVILRFEIELALIEGGLEVEKVPELWAQKMKDYLGLDTTGDYKNGPMQDIHWSIGAFGYFPTYTLGAMFAAQFMAAVRKDLGSDTVDQAIASGKMEPIFEWLKTKVWCKGSFPASGDELLEAATGERLNAEYYRKHLTQRYLHKV